MKNKDFAVLILTHGRPDGVVTVKSLRESGYTGDIYIIIDNEDKQADKYKDNYGDKVITFDKKAISETFDEGDNFEDRRAIIYARNASFQIAKDLGLKYFIQLDDDYVRFNYKYTDTLTFHTDKIGNLDNVFDYFIDFLANTPQLSSVAMAQGGDFIGGEENGIDKSILRKRKCMNSFFCSTEKPFQFIGRVNEDVNTYTHLASKGLLLLTLHYVAIEQKQTQSNKGGMSEMYLDSGTYVKSFYSVMYQPSSVRIAGMSAIHTRLHHKISWKNTVPMIIRENHAKQNKEN